MNATHNDCEFGSYLQGVARQATEPQAAATGLGETIPSEGGFVVAPPDIAAEIWSHAVDSGELLRRCTQLPEPTGNKSIVNQIHETDRSEGSRFGGLRVYRLSEADEITASQLSLAQSKRVVNKVGGLAYVTDELLQDATTLGATIRRFAALELAYRFEADVFGGTGAGMPLGLLNAGCKITVPKETGQTPTTIIAANLQHMIARLWGPSWRRAVWLFNQEMTDDLAALEVAGKPAFRFGDDSSGWPTILGRPAIPSEYCQVLGTEGDLILTDLSEYAIVSKATFDESMHVRFIQDEYCFRFLWRYDGCPFWASAITPDNGNDTQSPIITLAVRD